MANAWEYYVLRARGESQIKYCHIFVHFDTPISFVCLIAKLKCNDDKGGLFEQKIGGG